MKPDQPRDPREQLEVRITALLLGEASAFEEAELLETIKNDPELEAYYDEMRAMVKLVEESAQTAPMAGTAEAAKQPRLADDRRAALQKLFNQPAIGAIPVERSSATVVWLRGTGMALARQVLPIAAALVILLIAVGLFLPAGSKAKSKATRMARFVSDFEEPSGRVLSENALGEQVDQAAIRPNADVKSSRSSGRVEPAAAEPEFEYDEKLMQRYSLSPATKGEGTSDSGRGRERLLAAKPVSPTPPPPKPGIVLPSADNGGLADNNPVNLWQEAPASLPVPPTLAYRADHLPRPEPAALSAARGVTVGPGLETSTPARPSTVELESRFGRSVSPSDPVTLSVANGQAGGAAGASGQPASVAAGRTSYFFDSATTSSASNEGGLTHDLYAKAPATERWHFAQDSLATTTADVRTKSELDTRAKELADIRGGVRQQAAQRLAEREVEQLGEARVPSSGPAPVTRRFAGRNGLNEEWGAEVPALRQSEELVRSKDADGTRLNETRELAEATSSIDTLALESAPAEVLAKQVADVELKKVAAPDDKSDAFGAVGFSVLPGEQGAQSEAKIVDAQTAAADRFDRLARGESALGLQQVEGFSNEPGWVGALEQPAPSGAANGRFLGRSLHLDSRLAGLPPEGVVANSSDDGGIGGGGYGSSAVSAQEGPALDGGPQAGWGGIRFVTPAEDLPAGNQAVRAKLAEAEEAARGGELFEATRLFGDSMTLAGQSGDASAIEQAKRGLVNSRLAMASQAREAKDFELAAEQVDEVLKIAPDDVQVLKLKVVNDRELLVNEGRQSNKQAIQTAPPPPSLEPLPEISTKDNAFSTFSLNVSDVSYQLAKSALENGQLPDPARIRSEEFVNAFDYRDPAPAAGQRVAFNWERARNPFAHNRDLLRFSVQTAAAGREPGKALNLVILLDNSGSMERADRVRIVEEMMGVLAGQLQAQDRVSVISFARTARLLVDGMTGDSQQELLYRTTGLNPQGGTNLEDAMKLGYEVAQRHFQAEGNNRVIVLTDGAANLGNVDPQALRERVIAQRQKGIALDCFGIGWEGYNDNLLEQLSRNGDGRYGFINDPAAARTQFANQLAGALQVAAADVKAQVEFNPDRVTVYRQIGYQQHQLTKEQFRDNTVDAAEIGAAESGNALYSVQIDPNGTGPIGTFRVRYRVPSTGAYEEKEFVLAFQPTAPEMQAASPAMRLATTAASFAEWLANSPHAGMVDTGTLRNLIGGVPEVFAPDPRAAQLQLMIQQAAAISGR